jgi:hypothetical protein
MDEHEYELASISDARRPWPTSTMPGQEVEAQQQYDAGIHRRTLRKLDSLLLPFLALLFLFNSLDKSNVRVRPATALQSYTNGIRLEMPSLQTSRRTSGSARRMSIPLSAFSSSSLYFCSRSAPRWAGHMGWWHGCHRVCHFGVWPQLCMAGYGRGGSCTHCELPSAVLKVPSL